MQLPAEIKEFHVLASLHQAWIGGIAVDIGRVCLRQVEQHLGILVAVVIPLRRQVTRDRVVVRASPLGDAEEGTGE